MRALIALLCCQNDGDRPQICRDTWMQDAPKFDVDIVFLIGYDKPEPSRVGDILYLPCHDGYQELTRKSWEFFKWATRQTWDRVVKADSDSYICLPRLFAANFGTSDYIGNEPGGDRFGYSSGGGGTVFSRKAVEILANTRFPKRGAEDLTIGQILKSHGIHLHKDRRFIPWGNEVRIPLPTNDLITTHAIRPESEQRRVFEMCYAALQSV